MQEESAVTMRWSLLWQLKLRSMNGGADQYATNMLKQKKLDSFMYSCIGDVVYDRCDCKNKINKFRKVCSLEHLYTL
jgi:hypothetical protein